MCKQNANFALRAGAAAAATALRRLREDGTSAGMLESILSWEERQRLAGLSEWEELEKKVSEAAASVASRAATGGGTKQE